MFIFKIESVNKKMPNKETSRARWIYWLISTKIYGRITAVFQRIKMGKHSPVHYGAHVTSPSPYKDITREETSASVTHEP